MKPSIVYLSQKHILNFASLLAVTAIAATGCTNAGNSGADRFPASASKNASAMSPAPGLQFSRELADDSSFVRVTRRGPDFVRLEYFQKSGSKDIAVKPPLQPVGSWLRVSELETLRVVSPFLDQLLTAQEFTTVFGLPQKVGYLRSKLAKMPNYRIECDGQQISADGTGTHLGGGSRVASAGADGTGTHLGGGSHVASADGTGTHLGGGSRVASADGTGTHLGGGSRVASADGTGTHLGGGSRVASADGTGTHLGGGSRVASAGADGTGTHLSGGSRVASAGGNDAHLISYDPNGGSVQEVDGCTVTRNDELSRGSKAQVPGAMENVKKRAMFSSGGSSL